MQRRSLEDRYDLKDERPRNHGGRYIPTNEERARWSAVVHARRRGNLGQMTDAEFAEAVNDDAERQADYQDTLRSLLVGLR